MCMGKGCIVVLTVLRRVAWQRMRAGNGSDRRATNAEENSLVAVAASPANTFGLTSRILL